MKILVFGSLNIDKVYSLPHLPEKGETLYCRKYEIHVGGKGLNQAISFAKAGADVKMAGKVGRDGLFLIDYLKSNSVNTELIDISGGCTGHAVIEVDGEGQNQMILFPGANAEITEEYCDGILESEKDADLLMMQCETSCVEYMLQKAKSMGIRTAVNPSPFTEKVMKLPFDKIDYLILNRDEGRSITGEEDDDKISLKLSRLTGGEIILTLGGDGAVYCGGNALVRVSACKVEAVDTTGAGDTFTGYSLFGLISGASPEEALDTASHASAVAVMKPGAAETIPSKKEVEEFIEREKR